MSQDNSEIPIKAPATLDEARRAAIKCLETHAALADAATRVFHAACDGKNELSLDATDTEGKWHAMRLSNGQYVSEFGLRRAIMEAGIEFEEFHPYIVNLYNALRNGWNPICQFWPRLAEACALHGRD